MYSMLVLFVLLLLFAATTQALPCAQYNNDSSLVVDEWGCFTNASCVLDGALQCVDVNTTCAERGTRIHCHRGPACFWTGVKCVDRSVPLSMVQSDSYCHTLFNYSDIRKTGDACNSDPICEYDIYTAQCVLDREIMCPAVVDTDNCYVTAGCWWNPETSTCRPLARDYKTACAAYDNDRDTCARFDHSCLYDAGPPARCNILPKARAYPFYPLMQYCRLNIIHPFKQFCNLVEECIGSCGPPLKPDCTITASATALDLCQPLGRYVCRFLDRDEDCVDYSFCRWNISTSHCENPAGDDALSLDGAGSGIRVAVGSGDHRADAILVVLVLFALVLFLGTLLYCQMRGKGGQHRTATQMQVAIKTLTSTTTTTTTTTHQPGTMTKPKR